MKTLPTTLASRTYAEDVELDDDHTEVTIDVTNLEVQFDNSTDLEIKPGENSDRSGAEGESLMISKSNDSNDDSNDSGSMTECTDFWNKLDTLNIQEIVKVIAAVESESSSKPDKSEKVEIVQMEAAHPPHIQRKANAGTIALLRDHIKNKYAKNKHLQALNEADEAIIQKSDNFQNVGCLIKGKFSKQDKGDKCLSAKQALRDHILRIKKTKTGETSVPCGTTDSEDKVPRLFTVAISHMM